MSTDLKTSEWSYDRMAEVAIPVLRGVLVSAAAGLWLCALVVSFWEPAFEAARSRLGLGSVWLAVVANITNGSAIATVAYVSKPYISDPIEWEYEFWPTLGVFSLILAVMLVCFTCILYNLAAVAGVYNPFGGNIGWVGIFLFALDHAIKGLLFDFAEIFHLGIEPGIAINYREHVLLGLAVGVFRMAFASLAVAALYGIVRRWE
jgi:hypothetical protein